MADITANVKFAVTYTHGVTVARFKPLTFQPVEGLPVPDEAMARKVFWANLDLTGIPDLEHIGSIAVMDVRIDAPID